MHLVDLGKVFHTHLVPRLLSTLYYRSIEVVDVFSGMEKIVISMDPKIV